MVNELYMSKKNFFHYDRNALFSYFLMIVLRTSATDPSE